MAGVDLGIDLGTTKIIVYRRGKGIVLEEPSVVAYNIRTEQVHCFGMADNMRSNPFFALHPRNLSHVFI